MDNKVLNNIKERLLKDNDEYRCRQRTMADRYAAGYANGVEDTLVAVAAAEAAEQQAQNAPEPVVHGHWIKTEHMFASTSTGRSGNIHVCSECGEQSGVGFKTPWCAICGAKMDGGDTDV